MVAASYKEDEVFFMLWDLSKHATEQEIWFWV